MASGETDVTPGRTLSPSELVDNAKLNDLGLPIARVKQAAITAREIADGSITADKLDVELEAQIGLADGSVTTAKIVDDAVTAAKIADDLITAQAALLLLDVLDLFLVWDVSATALKKIDYTNLLSNLRTSLTLPASILTNTFTYDPPSISAGSTHTFTVTVTGAATTNNPAVLVTFTAALTSGLIMAGDLHAYVSAANTVTIRLYNDSGGSINNPAINGRVVVFQY